MTKPPDEWAEDFEELKKELGLYERKTFKLLALSIPAILVYHLFFASCLALIVNVSQIFILKYSKTPGANDYISEISILLVVGPVYGIRWARKRCQTACRPMMPWLLLAPLSLLLSLPLISVYDFLYTIIFFILHKQIAWPVDWQVLLQQYISIHQIKSLSAYFLKLFSEYFLATAGIVGTLAINYYGGLKKDSWLKLFVEDIS
ncbi:MAG: hypothetical protein NTV89_19415 [Proteobacteria bacterium]|nr:hypothetical protein [Pseudomonadota bacterium]